MTALRSSTWPSGRSKKIQDLSKRFGLPYFCSTELDPVLSIYITTCKAPTHLGLGLIGSPKLLKASSSAPKGGAWPHRNDSFKNRPRDHFAQPIRSCAATESTSAAGGL